MRMRPSRRIAVLLALVGFVGCIGASAAWAAVSCCTPACDPCPILVAKTTLASSPHKAVSLHALLPAAFDPVPLVRVAFYGGDSVNATRSLPPGFRSPMRN